MKASPAQILRMAFSDLHNGRLQHNFETGEIWWTQTVLNDKEVFPMIFVSETQNFKPVEWKNLGLTDYNLDSNYYYVTFTGPGKVENLKNIIRGDWIETPNLNENEFKMIYIAPLWGAGKNWVALLGETDKFVPVSKQRIKKLDYDESGNSPLKIELEVKYEIINYE